MISEEINFDAIVGPTHNFSGLSRGNLASTMHGDAISHPKKAALQGLEKMKFLHDLGVPQAVLPPQERPFLPILRQLGFTGTPQTIIETASKMQPDLYRRCCSASAMWAANSGWITPSCDSSDKRVQITPANLSSFFHRAIEADTTYQLFKRIFADESLFHVHEPLLIPATFADEGSANHMLICPQYGASGIHIFVHGRSAFHTYPELPKKFPARQTLEATEAIARRHAIFESYTRHLRQNPIAIDAGVFHNDVIAVSNLNLLLCHERAFVNQEEELKKLKHDFASLCDSNLKIITIKESDLSLRDTVDSYLFNSQLVSLPDGDQCLIAPMECKEMPHVNEILNSLIRDENLPIKKLRFIDLRESMANGGGPGCVRLRVILNPLEKEGMLQSILFTDELYLKLTDWVKKHYRDNLSVQDLADPLLYEESCRALDELTNILNLGQIYPFQSI